eukprot:737947-Hanusia_phi.AAC.1
MQEGRKEVEKVLERREGPVRKEEEDLVLVLDGQHGAPQHQREEGERGRTQRGWSGGGADNGGSSRFSEGGEEEARRRGGSDRVEEDENGHLVSSSPSSFQTSSSFPPSSSPAWLQPCLRSSLPPSLPPAPFLPSSRRRLLIPRPLLPDKDAGCQGESARRSS